MSDFNAEHNRVVWLDIPVVDLDRAVAFYGGVLGCEVSVETMQEIRFAVIAHEQGNGGCLVVNPDEVAADRGMPVHSLGPHGFRALVRDSEGNRLALHASNDT